MKTFAITLMSIATVGILAYISFESGYDKALSDVSFRICSRCPCMDCDGDPENCDMPIRDIFPDRGEY